MARSLMRRICILFGARKRGTRPAGGPSAQLLRNVYTNPLKLKAFRLVRACAPSYQGGSALSPSDPIQRAAQALQLEPPLLVKEPPVGQIVVHQLAAVANDGSDSPAEATTRLPELRPSVLMVRWHSSRSAAGRRGFLRLRIACRCCKQAWAHSLREPVQTRSRSRRCLPLAPHPHWAWG